MRSIIKEIPAVKERFRKEHGYRPDHRRKGLEKLFGRIEGCLAPDVHILSDEQPCYKKIVFSAIFTE
ncbi:MAG: hypothetical protein GY730_06825 [bacterium]|nr:hypothetical protein [bacterium]